MTRRTSTVEHTDAVKEVRSAVDHFFAASREPVLVEPGQETLALGSDNWILEFRSGRLTLEAWDESRNLVRRVTAVASVAPGRVELAVERFGKRTGTVVLVDRRAARNHDAGAHACRAAFREHFRRSLRRQFPDWRIAELTTDADLEHSLSPRYPRALLRKGGTAWAALAAPPDSPDPASIVTFGIIWLDYLRRRERRLTVEGLSLFLPAGRERVTCLRLRWLNSRAARFNAFRYFEDGFEEAVDLDDYGNLESHLAPASRPNPEQPQRVYNWLRQIAASVRGVECVPRNDGSISVRVRGLEFARATDSELLFGLETRRVATAVNLAEVQHLGAEIARMRSPDAANRENPLYTRSPEGWLESAVRGNLEEVDASLLPSPVYGQVPAFTAGDRDVIDLLAVARDGRLAVLELKNTEDIHLPMQALDYWLRVRWHAARGEFGAAGYFPGTRVTAQAPRLFLLAPALDFHPSNEVVLRFFSPEIEVKRLGVGLEWRASLKIMFRQ
jgi:hypothetical protein